MVTLTEIKTTKKTLANLETEVLFIGIHTGKQLRSTEKTLDNILRTYIMFKISGKTKII